MKSCPTCGTRYTDDTLSFCLSDGARLGGEEASDAVTVAIGETETFVRPRSSGAATPNAPTSRTGLAVAVTAAVMLILFAVVAIAGFLIWRNYAANSGNQTANRGENRGPVNSASPTPVSTTKPSPAASPKPTVAELPTPQTPKRASYPAMARIRMAKGRFSAPFSGEINPGDERSFVLTCRAGQSLSASVTGGSCVTFSGGGTSVSRTTVGGDNYLTVTNTCSTVARFSGTVSIF